MGTKQTMLDGAKQNIGVEAKLTLKNGLIILVRIVDARVAYGVPHYYVTPIAGEGVTRVKQGLDIPVQDSTAQ